MVKGRTSHNLAPPTPPLKTFQIPWKCKGIRMRENSPTLLTLRDNNRLVPPMCHPAGCRQRVHPPATPPLRHVKTPPKRASANRTPMLTKAHSVGTPNVDPWNAPIKIVNLLIHLRKFRCTQKGATNWKKPTMKPSNKRSWTWSRKSSLFISSLRTSRQLVVLTMTSWLY